MTYRQLLFVNNPRGYLMVMFMPLEALSYPC
jgi:hypothetical protein